MSVISKVFGKLSTGEEVKIFSLENKNGIQVDILNYGGIIAGIHVPDGKGGKRNVVLSYPDVAGYESDDLYIGATVGRVANRIAKGQFSLNGKTYDLAVNNGPNHLHGGIKGYNSRIWETSHAGESAIKLSLLSKAGEEGYPGDLIVDVTFEIKDNNQLVIEYNAIASADTIINLTNHSYFNLEGEESKSCLAHELKFASKKFAPTDETAIPTGEEVEVADGPFDFAEFKSIGKDIESDHQQIQWGKGYDHHHIVGGFEKKPRLIAEAKTAASNVSMKVYSTLPGFQFYTGNYLSGQFEERQGFCIETQNYPDAINQPQFPSPVLKKGERYEQQTIFEFITA
ncbi:aldose epimerase family protein [Persicobacter diffluens]|uniref:Aldose 1-epimerase n=1 Tax=Persicobacter diffluens TaxID=981 RepID=A0AAN4W0K8_9BACT|nr:aldose 1-epimerase [Persicobacter diffluens]